MLTILDSENELSEESLEFCANVEKHLQRSGAVNRFLANIVFVGLPGSGKSTLIARLLNLKGVDEMLKASGPTGVMNGIITVDVTEDEASMHAANIGESCEWQKVEFGLSCLRQMGMKCFVLKQAPENQACASPPDATDSEAAPVSKGSLKSPKKGCGDKKKFKLGKTPVKETVAKRTAEKQTPAKQTAEKQRPARPSVEQTPVNVMATVQNLLRKEGFSAVCLFLDKNTSLYLSDTGE